MPCQTALGLITGGEGNNAVADPGWPNGAAAIFNHPGRVAYWEGPPFGGGQWHAECRGDAKALNAVLDDFAKLDVKAKRVVVHDGVGQSFWINPNREKGKEAAARIDWTFMVWQPANWDRLRELPARLRPAADGDPDDGPPAQLDIYAGGGVRWADVVLPANLKVTDERLEAHGFAAADGTVLEGTVIDLATRRPIPARIKLERVEPQPKGGYLYPGAAETVADDKGHWVLKKAPAGWYRIVVDADGYVARIVGHARFDDQPSWHSYDSGLARPVTVSGKITDENAAPLAGVEVRLDDLVCEAGDRYNAPQEYAFTTGADGRFRSDQVPAGQASVWLRKSGYCRPGLGRPITVPASVVLNMTKSARVRVTVDFAGAKRPQGYIVHIEPEGGEAVGKYGGSGQIDAKDQFSFTDVPPARYVVHGRPNPGNDNEETEPVTIDLKGGETTDVTLKVK
ncbi:MAG: carboxypeptidase regulatory-like domain-containing protein [Planctomycetia bacterium]|nr:carboxypeptidase regulatory-like domain-containing protein [Planctomycetia bacterium]